MSFLEILFQIVHIVPSVTINPFFFDPNPDNFYWILKEVYLPLKKLLLIDVCQVLVTCIKKVSI